MGKPFEHADDEGGGAKARFRARVAAARGAGRDATDDDDDDDDDDEGDDDEGDDEGEGSEREESDDVPVISTSPRQAKKNARRAQYDEDLATARRELAESNERIARLEGAMSQRTSQRDATDEQVEDPFEEEINQLEEGQRVAWEAYNNKPAAQRTQADLDVYKKKAREIQNKVASVRVDRELARRGIVPGQDPVRAARQAAFEAEFSDVFANPNAKAHASATFAALRAKGRPDSKETLDEAMAATRREFKLGKPAGNRPPPERTKKKLEGQRNGSGGGNRQSSGDDEGLSLRMTAPLRRMANARYPHIEDERKRFEKFARSPAGRKAAKSLRDGG